MYYISLYYNLCSSRSQLKEHCGKGSGLHRHHIVPRHMGGTDDQNFTYLTPREHIIAHFLLWKIHKNPNDLRSMHMLGAELSVEQRRIVGIFCRDNQIGFFSAKKEVDRDIWRARGIESQKNSGSKNSFYFWSTEEGRKKRSAMGGKAGSRTQIKNKTSIFDPTVQRKAAVLGGKAMKGMICISKDDHRTRVKPENLELFLEQGYKRGWLS